MKLTQKLLGFLNRAFSRDPVQFLAMRLRYDGSMTWKVEDAVLTTSVIGGSGAALSVDLTGYSIAELVNYLNDQTGYTVIYQASSEAALVGARTLLDGAGDQDSSNGDHLYAYTSLTWAYLDANAVELKAAREQIYQMLRQMTVTTGEGEWLDEIGGHYGIRRLNGETDALYGPRIIYEVIRPRNNNKAIEIAIGVATGGLPSKVTDVTEIGSLAPLHDGSIDYDGAYLYNASGTQRRNLFDVEYAFDLEGSEDIAPFQERVLALIDKFRAAGTHMRSIMLTGGSLSDTVGFSAADVFESQAIVTVDDTAALPTDAELAHSGTLTMVDSSAGAAEGDEELASKSTHLYNGAHYYGGSGRQVYYDSGALVSDPAPTLQLDFMSGSMPPEVTFTRASGGGRFNAAGVYEWLGNNQPRFDYDPLTLALKGLLIEPQAATLITYSSNFAVSAWASNAGGLSVDVAAGLAPDGTFTANKIVETATTDNHRRGYSLAASAGQLRRFSIYAKAAERTKLSCWSWSGGDTSASRFDLAAGTCSGSNLPIIEPLPGGWYRCSFNVPALHSASVVFSTDPTGTTNAFLGEAGKGLYVWGAQLEYGGIATSFIPSVETFTSRASTATYLDAYGVMQTAASNIARSNAYGYDSAGVLRRIGLLLEGGATNYLLFSDDVSNNWWQKRPNVSVTANAGIGPTAGYDSVVNTVSGGLTNGVHSANSIGLAAANNTVTASCMLAVASGTADVYLKLSPWSGGSADGSKLVTLTTTPKRFTITHSFGAGAVGVPYFEVSPLLANTPFLVRDMQLELGAVATSHIPTAGSQVTRAADVSSSAAVTRAADSAQVLDLSPWYNPVEGTLYARVRRIACDSTGDEGAGVELSNGSLQSQLVQFMYDSGSYNLPYVRLFPGSIRVAGAGPSGTSPNFVAGEPARKFVAAIKSGNHQLGFAGAVGAVYSDAVMPSGLNRLNIRSASDGIQGSNFVGHIHEVAYWDRRLAPEILTLISSG